MLVCSAPHACLIPAEVRAEHQIPPELKLKMVVSHHLGPEQEEQVLLTAEPTCQPQLFSHQEKYITLSVPY